MVITSVFSAFKFLSSTAAQTFDWGQPPAAQQALEDVRILELDIAAFTSGPDAEQQVPPERRGTYLGVLDRLDSIAATGASVVLLTSSVMLSGRSESQFGVSPVSLFAPEVALAGGAANAAHQLKEMIKGLHAAGIQVYMQVRLLRRRLCK